MKTTADKQTASAPETRTFTHVNTGKPAGIRETQNEQDNREARTIPAEKPTATPHGVPLTPEVAEYLSKEKHSGNPEWPKTPTKREELQAHADKLAEALRDVLQWFSEPYDPKPKSLPEAKQALAAYEESR